MPVLEQFKNFIRHGKAASAPGSGSGSSSGKDGSHAGVSGGGVYAEPGLGGDGPSSSSAAAGSHGPSSSAAAAVGAGGGAPVVPSKDPSSSTSHRTTGNGTGTGNGNGHGLGQSQAQLTAAQAGLPLPPSSAQQRGEQAQARMSPGLTSASAAAAFTAAAAASASHGGQHQGQQAQQQQGAAHTQSQTPQAKGNATTATTGTVATATPASTTTTTTTTTTSTPTAGTTTTQNVAAQLVESERRASEQLPIYEGIDERFTLLAKMGDGAFSNVYKARDRKTGQKVAIKVVRKYELNSNQEDRLNPQFRKKNRVTERANILKEVQIMRGLKHDGIVKLLDFSESRDHYFLVLELLEGGELFHQIVKLTYFSEPLSRHVILQVAHGIRYLHEERGVVHRDIKPENLLFESIKIIPSKYNKARPYDEEKEDEGEYMPGIGGGGIGKVKIADFGLSKIVWEESTMTPCGTVGYTAPEIVKDERYSKSVDMWALGCVLYTLLCGFPPFYDESISVLTEKVAKGYYTFLSPWWDDISHSAKDLITHLLCVDPRKRYTIDEFLAHPWCNVKDPVPDLNSADIALAKASEMPLDSPLLQSMKGGKQQRAGLMSPGINQLKEAFDVTYAVHRMEEEGAARRGGYGAGNRGELMGLNEEDEMDEVEDTTRKYGQEAGRAVERQRGARTSESSTSSSSSARQAQQQQQTRQQQDQAAQQYQGRGGADPKLAAAVLYDGRAGQRDRGSRSNRRAFELNMNNATLLGRRNKALDPTLGSLDSRIAAGGGASPMRVD